MIKYILFHNKQIGCAQFFQFDLLILLALLHHRSSWIYYSTLKNNQLNQIFYALFFIIYFSWTFLAEPYLNFILPTIVIIIIITFTFLLFLHLFFLYLAAFILHIILWNIQQNRNISAVNNQFFFLIRKKNLYFSFFYSFIKYIIIINFFKINFIFILLSIDAEDCLICFIVKYLQEVKNVKFLLLLDFYLHLNYLNFPFK